MDSYVKQTNKSELFSYVWFLWLRVNIDVLRLRVQHHTPYIYMITNISQAFLVWYDQRNSRKLAYNEFKVSGISIGLLWVFHCLDFFHIYLQWYFVVVADAMASSFSVNMYWLPLILTSDCHSRDCMEIGFSTYNSIRLYYQLFLRKHSLVLPSTYQGTELPAILW
jgi:hypothetical protein